MNTSKNKALGVAIGRFQIPELHAGHLNVLNTVRDRHERMLILLGTTSVRLNTSDPYSFEVRKLMLQREYPDALILPIKDSPESNIEWSKRVDLAIKVAAEGRSAVLYGSRDSFIPLYTGEYPCEHLEAPSTTSGTEIREAFRNSAPIDSVDFRKGILHAILHQYAITDPTVDVVVFDRKQMRILLGKRGPTSTHWRFMGGFVDRKDTSYEMSASREHSEETENIRVGDPVYIGSDRINDPRYQRSDYGIMTAFFVLPYVSGEPVAGDDMGLVGWHPVDERLRDIIVTEHRGLVELLLKYAGGKTVAAA